MNEERAAFESEIRAAARAADWTTATTLAIQTYGDELLGYLVAMTRSEVEAGEAFSLVCEQLWKSLPTFRWECSLRNLAYVMARQAISRVRRDPHRRRAVAFDGPIAEALAEVKSRTATFLRTENRDKVAALRAGLEPDDQTLLILRIDRQLQWREIARVLAGDEPGTEAELGRRAATLRKRFERLKDQLRAQLRPTDSD